MINVMEKNKERKEKNFKKRRVKSCDVLSVRMISHLTSK